MKKDKVSTLPLTGKKTIQSGDKVDGNPLTIIGAELTIPITRLRIIATDFERSPYFPEAVALAEIVEGDFLGHGDHLQTPWGVVKIF